MNTITNFLRNTSLIFALMLTISQAFATESPTAEEVISFEIQSETTTVEITWQMPEGFDGKVQIQRAGMDMQFETVGELSNDPVNQFVDEQPQTGISFYRLAIQRADGSITYQKAAALSR
ncbi:MAG: hypothetical protein AAF632_15285 [Bacteroidota bacterium]